MTAREKANAALDLMKEAITEFIRQHPEGVTNSEIARALDLKSDFEGQQRDYLSWSVLGILVNEGAVKYEKRERRKVYITREPGT